MGYDPRGESDRNVSKAYFIRDLEKLGTPMTSRVVVNGRVLMLSAVIKLVEAASDETTFARRGFHITIEPDPFSLHGDAPEGDDELRGLVSRLIERQPDTDRQAARDRRWWGRLFDRLRGGPPGG